MNSAQYSSFCTDFARETSRFEHWAGTVSKALNQFELDSCERENFDARTDTFQLGGMAGLFSQGSSPFSGRRTRQHVALAKPHSYHIVLARGGNGVIRQGHWKIAYGAGDLVLFNTTQDIVVEVQDVNFVSLTISEALIRTWIPDPEVHQVRVLRGDRGWAAVLSTYLSNLKPEIIAATTSAQHLQMSEHILSLYAFALEEAGFSPQADAFISAYNNTDLSGRMLNWLAERYMDPEISAAHLAQHFGISVREVHRRFSRAQQGTTFLDALRELRMAAAIRMLSDRHFSALTIAEIGYRSGFSEPAYFGRVFRQMQGCSPGAFAKAHHRLVQEG